MGGKKRFFESELNGCWSTAREKGMEYAKARGHSPNSLHNDQKDMLYVACEMLDQGIEDPALIDTVAFNAWRSYTMSDSNRSMKAISENGFKKRVEALKLLLKANKLNEVLEVVEMYKFKFEAKELLFWREHELDAMTERAMLVFENIPEKRACAMAHFIHIDCPPRREDTARMKWSCIDLEKGEILFPAQKNGRQPGNCIMDKLLRYYQEWKDVTSQYPDGDVYVFPSSMAQKSGTQKTESKHVSGKTIAGHLAFIRNGTILYNGERPQELSSQKYRASLAMRALAAGCSIEYVAKVLGDSVQTVEQYYARFLLNDQHRKEHAKMHRKSTRITSEGTTQPSWLKRHKRPLATARQLDISEGFRLYEGGYNGSRAVASFGSEGYGRWGI